jgi:hypothetical protein
MHSNIRSNVAVRQLRYDRRVMTSAEAETRLAEAIQTAQDVRDRCAADLADEYEPALASYLDKLAREKADVTESLTDAELREFKTAARAAVAQSAERLRSDIRSLDIPALVDHRAKARWGASSVNGDIILIANAASEPLAEVAGSYGYARQGVAIGSLGIRTEKHAQTLDQALAACVKALNDLNAARTAERQERAKDRWDSI